MTLNMDPEAPVSPFSNHPPILSTFEPASLSEVKAAILSLSNSTCALDFLPTSLLKSCLDVLLPPITTLLNLCIKESTIPADFKHALVTPLLKNSSLDKDDLSSYRPISNLNFLSKVLERLIHNRLLIHLNSFQALSPYQSAYRKFHSVETALLRIQNDLLLAMERKEVSALVLLDLSAAFDTVDHSILLSRLSLNFGIEGPALALLTSYLTGRTQSVVVNTHVSQPCIVTSGVPQGSVLGPLLFTLYTTPLSYQLSYTNLLFHFYADDTQLYISFSARQCESALQTLSETLEMIHSWLSRNQLCLNPSKTEFMLIGTKQQRSNIKLQSLTFSGTTISASDSARNLGIIFDSNLALHKQISAVSKSCHYCIRQLRQIRPMLDHNTTVMLTNSLVSSKLDFCNSLYSGLSDTSINRLQHIQNSLVRAVFPGTRKRDHITPLCHKLHWLPVEQSIKDKIALLTFKLSTDNPHPTLLNFLNLRRQLRLVPIPS